MPAEEALVLSPSDVRNIRSYVQHKYASMPQEQRAEIVADAVTRIIHKQLPAFEESVKRQITSELIRSAVMEQGRPVRADDIFGACLSLDRSIAAIAAPFHAWIERQLQIQCESDVMGRLLDRLAESDGETSGRQVSLWSLLRAQLASQPVKFLQDTASTRSAEVVTLPNAAYELLKTKFQRRNLMYLSLCAMLVVATVLHAWSLSRPAAGQMQPPIAMKPVQKVEIAAGGLPMELRYTSIDEDKLISYLETKSSVLAEQPYFDAIIDAAHAFDIHPILLFAITGQEQAFVPSTKKQAGEIANNPFNVFHSWKEYNTTIHDSAEIAARTIFNLSKDRPADADAFTWINRKYAEDPHWSDGVRSIFGAIAAYVGEK
ncbi:hypothetical protein [Paenibacillus harenae]|uniref:hypothetical protein n=1 Tax=Paenibacillus harenae TaxID=306543 RepID=UPI00279227F0|nr:hypothetical protein [Paenibacillus harenae]MDQ0057994.1 hypothetical protein [Paenibacillus harenae]